MRTLLLLAAIAAPHLAHADVTPSHVIDIWYDWPSPVASLDVTMTVSRDPGLASSYYWSHFFVLEGTRSGEGNERQGYMGLQTSGGGPRAVIFSMWNAVGASPSCVTFGGEGVGYKCRLDYDWQVGHAYHFNARSLGDDWWRGTVTDETTGTVTTIGDIHAPAGSGLAKTSVLFDEVYRDVASCDALAPATITFSDLTADGIKPTWTGTTTPAPCSGAATLDATGEITTISTGHVGPNSLGSLAGFTWRGSEVRRTGGECLDAEGGATSAGTRVIAWACHGGANQQWVRRGSALQLAGTDQCVASVNGELQLAPCSVTLPGSARPMRRSTDVTRR